MDGVQSTTNPCGVGIVVNGPIRNVLDINCSRNCMGPGWQANATIGRAMSLMWLNIGGAKPVRWTRHPTATQANTPYVSGRTRSTRPGSPSTSSEGSRPRKARWTVNSFNGTLNIIGATYTEIDSMLHVIAHDFSQWGATTCTSARETGTGTNRRSCALGA